MCVALLMVTRNVWNIMSVFVSHSQEREKEKHKLKEGKFYRVPLLICFIDLFNFFLKDKMGGKKSIPVGKRLPCQPTFEYDLDTGFSAFYIFVFLYYLLNKNQVIKRSLRKKRHRRR